VFEGKLGYFLPRFGQRDIVIIYILPLD
jgi:hypothetical protein